MKCPFCKAVETSVLESRSLEDGSIRRRRECNKCQKRFTTIEQIKRNFLWVIKKDGKREMFEKDKVKRGILRAIEKRPVSLELVDEIVDQIEMECLKKEKQEIPTREIGNLVLKKLKKVDKVAWLRFASVYLEFADFGDFEKAIG